MTIEQFFARLWADYVAMTPQAKMIRQVFEDRGETIINDHVAFRTLSMEPIQRSQLARHILNFGYSEFEQYVFPDKKLLATSFTPPEPDLPCIFLSELKVHELSRPASAILQRLVGQIDARRLQQADILWAGRLWEPIRLDEYQLLLAESEYAAWVAALGIRPNHFTISINHLVHSRTVEDVLRIVEGLGLNVNASGGRVKGTPEVWLEQGSTMADVMPIEFADGQVCPIPTCYYEFAKRYPMADGKLFPGFVAANADKIFESTSTLNDR